MNSSTIKNFVLSEIESFLHESAKSAARQFIIEPQQITGPRGPTWIVLADYDIGWGICVTSPGNNRQHTWWRNCSLTSDPLAFDSASDFKLESVFLGSTLWYKFDNLSDRETPKYTEMKVAELLRTHLDGVSDALVRKKLMSIAVRPVLQHRILASKGYTHRLPVWLGFLYPTSREVLLLADGFSRDRPWIKAGNGNRVITPYDPFCYSLEEAFAETKAFETFPEPPLITRHDPTNSSEIQQLVHSELEGTQSPRIRQSLREILVKPYQVYRIWDYGPKGLTYPCWVIADHLSGRGTALAYSKYGFGPKAPWGLIWLEPLTSMGDDSAWFSSLAEAFQSSFFCQYDVKQ